ncbi:MAG TPA: LuxR C-terminal-related transcriptional regulator [Bryobacteraceae bacterium]|jgi:DNA-binding CsgD family transcriptional regulator
MSANDHAASANRLPESGLTPREIEVLKLVVSGLTTKQVAESLGISFKTAACHRMRIMEKLDIHETAGLVHYAFRHGYLSITREDPSPSEMDRLFARVRATHEEVKLASREYQDFLNARNDFGVHSPDGVTGARMRHQDEFTALQKYHAALEDLRRFLLDDAKKSGRSAPPGFQS